MPLKLTPPPSSNVEFDFNWRQWLGYLASFLSHENWHYIGDSGEPGFLNSWVNYGFGEADAAYYIDPFDVIHIKGTVKLGVLLSEVFILPEKYRPSTNRTIATTTAGSTSPPYLYIKSNGSVAVKGNTNNSWQSLECCFRLDD